MVYVLSNPNGEVVEITSFSQRRGSKLNIHVQDSLSWILPPLERGPGILGNSPEAKPTTSLVHFVLYLNITGAHEFTPQDHKFQK